MKMKSKLILLLILVGLSAVTGGRGRRMKDCFTNGDHCGSTSIETIDSHTRQTVDDRYLSNRQDQLDFLAQDMATAKYYFEVKWNDHEWCSGGSIRDFNLISVIGGGGTSRVVLGKHNKFGHYYAIKVMHKADIVNRQAVNHVLSEKRILRSVHFPFLVKMELCFKDNANLYIAMKYYSCGVLPTGLNENVVKFYAAQIVLALHYLHSMNVIYRDLKLENILISDDAYIRLADFGYAIRVDGEYGRASEIVGTVHYFAPEMLRQQPYDKSVDWWALGILIYRMVSGHYPFDMGPNEHPLSIYEKIGEAPLVFDDNRFSKQLQNLLKNLLNRHPQNRYSVQNIVRHSWFEDIDWQKIYGRTADVPFRPTCKPAESFKLKKNAIKEAIGRTNVQDEYGHLFEYF